MAFPLGPVAAGAAAGYEIEREGLLDTSTPAGWAAIIALGGFALLVLSLSGEGGFVNGIVRAIQFLLVLAAGEAAIHYVIRQKSLRHPESPFWGGAGLDW